MTAAELSTALVRTTLAASAAACLAGLLLAWLKVESSRIHRGAWALVVLQGWLLLPWTFEIESPPTPAAPHPAFVSGTSDVDATLLGNMSSAAYTPPTLDAGAAPLRIFPLAILAWFAGAVLVALAAVGRYVGIVRALPLGNALENSTWQREWQRERTAMGVRNRVDFRLTDRLGPLVAYIPFAYLLLAPRSVWTALTPPERVAILRHELAHIRRRDLWKSLALRVLALPQWFNPFVWLAVRRFDEAAEWACDAAACSTACDRPAVAGALLHTAELTASHAAPRVAGLISAVPSANQRRRSSAFSRRIRRLVAPSLKEESTMKKLIVPALLAIIAVGQLVRVERVAAKPAEERQSKADDEAKTGPDAAANPAKRKEYVEAAWPRYVIEPPDILSIEGVKLVPKAPHALEPFDVVLVRVQGAHPEQPIDDTYAVDADGSINLGPSYGRIKIVGRTIDEAESHIRDELAKKLTDVTVSASLVASAGAQQVSGQHLVAMDGRVNLGVYGSTYVAGMTLEEARAAIEKTLSAQLEQPQVAVDVLAYNSKVYYVIYKGGKLGDNVNRLPITGNETVLDAVASMGGLSSIASNTMWLARPAANGVGPEQILPVAWDDIARGESSATNYQLMPGDRLFIETLPADGGKTAAAGKVDSQEHDHNLKQTVTMTLKVDGTHRVHMSFVKYRSGMTVGDAIREGVYPNPIDFSKSHITLIRKEGAPERMKKIEWLVAWDAARGGPTNDGDQTLRAGDQIVIDARTPRVKSPTAVDQLPSPYHLSDDVQYYQPAPPDHPYAASSPSGADQPTKALSSEVAFDVSFLQDPQGTLADFGDLVKAGAMIGDTRTTRSALQVFEKHKLVFRTDAPRLACEIGDGVDVAGPSHLVVLGNNGNVRREKIVGEPASIQVTTRRLDDKRLVVGVSVTQGGRMNKVETVADRSNPETTIMRLNSTSGPSAKGGVYVVVTPRLNK